MTQLRLLSPDCPRAEVDAEVTWLSHTLICAKHAYYNLHTSVLSDIHYDILERELKTLCKIHGITDQYFLIVGSALEPTQGIIDGANRMMAFVAKHPIPQKDLHPYVPKS
jgi:NAD-dependent DNA ligase